MSEKILQMNHIIKEFSGVRVLKDVSFDLRAGEVHALIGENGAGKSTLIKVLGGVYFQENGDVVIDGQIQKFTCAQDSIKAGVGIIYQEFNLVPTLSIAENIFLGKEMKKPGKRLNRSEMIRQAQELMETLGFENMDCSKNVQTLSVAQQQMVEIGKAIFNDSKILVMDEPTAVLTDKESKYFFDMVKKLREKGVGIIYVSHRLEEVLELSDRITVLRDGECITELDNSKKTVTKEKLVNLMVGRTLEQYYPNRESCTSEEIVLSVEELTRKDSYREISFQVKKGEILGITGLVGAGRTEVVKSIIGAMKYDSGEVKLNGKPVHFLSPHDAIQEHIAFIPENRKEEGLFLDTSIANNMFMANYNRISRKGVLRKKLKKNFLNTFFSKLDIRPNDPEKPARDFSGGNQQKAILAKWMAIEPTIMILDEPTRGIDIGAKAEIYKLMDDLSKKGCSIIMVSSEMTEIIGMCDRVIVMAEGRVTAELDRTEFSQERIMAASSETTQKAG